MEEINTPGLFRVRQQTCLRLKFQPHCPPLPTNADLIRILKGFSGKVYLEVIIGHSLFTIELKKYKFIEQLKKVGISRECDLAIARYDYTDQTMVLFKLH